MENKDTLVSIARDYCINNISDSEVLSRVKDIKIFKIIEGDGHWDTGAITRGDGNSWFDVRCARDDEKWNIDTYNGFYDLLNKK